MRNEITKCNHQQSQQHPTNTANCNNNESNAQPITTTIKLMLKTEINLFVENHDA